MSSDPSFKQQGHDRFTIYSRLSLGKNVDDFIFIYLAHNCGFMHAEETRMKLAEIEK